MISSIYRKIMVATDGSENVRKAVETAIEIAKISGAKLYAVYVINYGGPSITYPGNVGWERVALDYFKTEGREATTYVENLAKVENVNVNPYFWKEILRMRLSILLKKTILTLLLRVHLEELEFKDSCWEAWLKMW